MGEHKTNPPETVRSLEDMVNSRPGLDDRDKKDLVELAEIHGLTSTGMQEVFDMMDTEQLPYYSLNPNPEVSKAIDKASPEAREVYGSFHAKRVDRIFETE